MKKEELSKVVDEIMDEEHMMMSSNMLTQRIKKMNQRKMMDNLMQLLIKNNITDKATCLLVMGRIKTQEQYQQMMNYLTQEKNLTEEQVTNKAIEISKNY